VPNCNLSKYARSGDALLVLDILSILGLGRIHEQLLEVLPLV